MFEFKILLGLGMTSTHRCYNGFHTQEDKKIKEYQGNKMKSGLSVPEDQSY